jgi:Na+-driven multidrug efflux pump
MSTGSFGLSLVSLDPRDDDAAGGKPSEITPLLVTPAGPPALAAEKYTTFRNTVPDVVSLATPVFASTLLTYIIPSISLIFCGHLGDDRYLAAAGLASSLSNVTGSAVVQGLLTALDCLASQAFGCRNYNRFCTLYQRSLVVLLVASVPVRV